jgi:hypothetical protein
VAAALGLTACSDDSSGGDEGSSGGSGFSAESVSAAEDLLAEYSDFPSDPDLEPLGATPPSDHSVVFITCPLPACAEMGDAYEAAAGELGWQAQVLTSEFTPEAYTSAWNSALSAQPDGIFYIGMFPNTTIEAQLQTAKDAGVWVVQNSPEPGTEISADSVINGAVGAEARYDIVAKLQAAMVIADADATDGITFMYSPAAPSYAFQAEQFQKYIEDAGGTVDFLEINQQDIGTALPQQVVSYLQRNPDTRYLVSVDDTLLPGVPDAIAAAGIDSPKVIGAAVPSPDNLAWIEDGQQYGSVYGDTITDVWNAVDIMARLSVQEEPADRAPVGVVWVVGQDNVGDYPEGFPGIPDAYTEAWGVS